MKKAVVFVVALMVLAGCSTTNAFISMKPDYSALPAEDLKTVAAAIEAIVAEGQEEFTLDSAGGIVVDTPEIKQAVRERYARSYDNVARDLAAVEDLRVLDFNGHQIMTHFALSELGEPIKFES